ncbi:KilA-N domain-containing protein [Pseudochelatococcus contaminans]|uniref:KilA-N domain-containing protein n=1 Tax=Pseudochelatococcus contaminans TaxID=1538103 RepID=A0A7W6EIS9_9HYPH|nr:KilA-N domain-containing protein [Pseudochelatococcus contaminans]MBB3811459.1 hypothetical protein [Pseudochelatococcus contaminans]
MSNGTYSTPAPLVYNGEVINARGETLSLTDMWKAAGSDPAKAPAQWQRLPQSVEFIDHVSAIVGKSHNGIFQVVRGGNNPGTWAHWHVALAYAKYLSPEFHVWCNEVVRAHMEGRRADAEQSLTRYDASVIGNIVKNCTGVVIREQLEVVLPTLIDQMVAAKLAEHNLMIRYGKTAGQIWDGARLPKLKGGAAWLGNRLAEGQCLIDGGGRAEIGGRAVRLFDPDKAAIAMKNGLLLLARQYVEGRKGQMNLFPIRGGRTDEDRPSIQ